MSISLFDNLCNYLKFYINLLDPILLFDKDNRLKQTDTEIYSCWRINLIRIFNLILKELFTIITSLIRKNRNDNIDNNKNAR